MAWLSVRQVAELLGASDSTVVRMEAEGSLPAARRGGRRGDRRWDLDEILALRARPGGVERVFGVPGVRVSLARDGRAGRASSARGGGHARRAGLVKRGAP